MKPELRQQIGEWGTVFENIRQGGYHVNGTFYKFEGLLDFSSWYYSAGYGGDAEKVEKLAKYMWQFPEATMFFYFISSLDEEHTTPSEGEKR